MAGGSSDSNSRELDQTPTWAVAAVVAVIIIISIILEKVLHKFGQVFFFFFCEILKWVCGIMMFFLVLWVWVCFQGGVIGFFWTLFWLYMLLSLFIRNGFLKFFFLKFY